MKFKHLLTATALMLSISVVAQPKAKEETKEEEGFKFTTIKELPVTSVKDQNQAGTCWCYSSLAFFEAELLRMGKPVRLFRNVHRLQDLPRPR
jgi:C1A family cysteine protease